jgi:hypothetical protein
MYNHALRYNDDEYTQRDDSRILTSDTMTIIKCVAPARHSEDIPGSGSSYGRANWKTDDIKSCQLE